MVIAGAEGNFSSGGDLRKLGEWSETQVHERMSQGAWLFAASPSSTSR
jgi:enoyl-CoA hydratase/carnithine racemase